MDGWGDAHLSAVSPFPRFRGLSPFTPREKVHFLNSFYLGLYMGVLNGVALSFPNLEYLGGVRGLFLERESVDSFS